MAIIGVIDCTAGMTRDQVPQMACLQAEAKKSLFKTYLPSRSCDLGAQWAVSGMAINQWCTARIALRNIAKHSRLTGDQVQQINRCSINLKGQPACLPASKVSHDLSLVWLQLASHFQTHLKQIRAQAVTSIFDTHQLSPCVSCLSVVDYVFLSICRVIAPCPLCTPCPLG